MTNRNNKNQKVKMMIEQKKSGKLLFIATTLTVMSLIAVAVASSALLGTFNGNAVTVNDVASGTVTYSTDGGSTYSATASSFNVGGSLFARFEVSSCSYSGPATLTWQLQEFTTTWTNIGSSVTTSVSSISTSQPIYASANGTTTSLHNFGTDIHEGGSYRVSVTVNSV